MPMRGMPLILLASALPALAQLAEFGSTPVNQQPPWMEAFRKIYTPQGQAAPIGSLDQEVDKAWAAALAAGPLDPSFESAAQQAAQYFLSQGYDRKAESIFRQAISAAGKTDATKARSLHLALARNLTQEQKFLAAASLIQEVVEEIKAAPDQASSGEQFLATAQLAQLREQMGEFEAAEALLREVKTLQSAPPPQPPAVSPTAARFNRAAYPGFGFVRVGNLGSYPKSADLVGFYQRQGQTAKAEALLKSDIESAATSQERYQALRNYVYFLNSQQRLEESIAQQEKLIAMQSGSSQPEEQRMLANSRQNLAQTLAMAGKPEKALDILRQNVTQSSGDAFQRSEALRFYAQMLIQQKQFDEAEKVVEQIRHPTGNNATEMSKYAEPMADQLLANIRQMQNRTEEARALRERTQPQNQVPEGTPVPIWNLLQPVQEAMARHKYDEAIAQFQRTLAEATPRIRSNPEEISAFTNVIYQMPQGRQEERQQLMRTILSTLDGITPTDHPRIARALGQLVNGAMQGGLSTAETTRLIEREEKILIATKGEDSPALNDISRQRAQLFSFRGDYADAATELKRAVKRSEAASGSKSQPTLQAMRELTQTLQVNNDSWPEEETLRLAIIERSGQSNSMIHDMSALAGRYFAVGQRENAIVWMDKTIELASKHPQTAMMIQGFEQQRSHFANAQNQPHSGGGPFYAPGGARWFDTSGFSGTQGTLLGNRPVPSSVQRVIVRPNASPAPAAPSPPPQK